MSIFRRLVGVLIEVFLVEAEEGRHAENVQLARLAVDK